MILTHPFGKSPCAPPRVTIDGGPVTECPSASTKAFLRRSCLNLAHRLLRLTIPKHRRQPLMSKADLTKEADWAAADPMASDQPSVLMAI